MSSAPALSIVVPAFCEADRLPGTTEALLRWADRHQPDTEVLLVDDGSPDETARVAQRLATQHGRVRATPLPRHQGKGAAVRHGMCSAHGAAMLFLDADLAYGTEPIQRLLDALQEADLAIGRRDITTSGYRYPAHRRLATLAFNYWADAWLRLGIHDTQCGIKAFRGDVGRALAASTRIPGFGFDLELLHLARRWGLRIASLPVRMQEALGPQRSSVRTLRHGARLGLDAVAIRWRSATGHYPSRLPSPPPAMAIDNTRREAGRAHT